jgi:hypothetical protein
MGFAPDQGLCSWNLMRLLPETLLYELSLLNMMYVCPWFTEYDAYDCLSLATSNIKL